MEHSSSRFIKKKKIEKEAKNGMTGFPEGI
jgi:hypothetical protein